MKRHLTTLLLIFILLIGLALVLYPTVSNWWNSMHSSQAISAYADQVASLDDERYDALWQEAVEYNRNMNIRGGAFVPSDTQKARYSDMLNVGGSGVMGAIEIPSINVSLPIYHGTDENILQIAVGHLDWSSLPVGGEGSHCVLSGHRGLPSARLFTDLDALRIGDLFMIRVLGEILSYEVDQILIVEPYQVESLRVEQGMDLCTLVTCTPYGVNSHRLLIRGHRVENTPQSQAAKVTANAMQVDSLITATILAVPMALIAIILLLTAGDKGNKKKVRYQREIDIPVYRSKQPPDEERRK